MTKIPLPENFGERLGALRSSGVNGKHIVRVLVSGKYSEDETPVKTNSAMKWLFGGEFPEIALIFVHCF